MSSCARAARVRRLGVPTSSGSQSHRFLHDAPERAADEVPRDVRRDDDALPRARERELLRVLELLELFEDGVDVVERKEREVAVVLGLGLVSVVERDLAHAVHGQRAVYGCIEPELAHGVGQRAHVGHVEVRDEHEVHAVHDALQRPQQLHVVLVRPPAVQQDAHLIDLQQVRAARVARLHAVQRRERDDRHGSARAFLAVCWLGLPAALPISTTQYTIIYGSVCLFG